MPRTFLIIFFSLAASAFAQLKWERPWQQFHRSPEDGHLDTKFAFRNGGTTPITIKSIKTSCGCTTAKLEKRTYAPGETGEVLAHYQFGDRKGAHRKSVTVTTDDGSSQELNLVVFIHPGLEITPALVFWRVGQPGEPQTVQLTAEPGTPVRVKSVASSNPRVTATLQTLKPGEQYAVQIKPADTTQRETAELSVQTDFPPDAPRAFTIHARIK
jgi:hypothetical protein